MFHLVILLGEKNEQTNKTKNPQAYANYLVHIDKSGISHFNVAVWNLMHYFTTTMLLYTFYVQYDNYL